jgi:protein pelota
MKILKREIIAKNGYGTVKLLGEEAEDMWHLYNLITEDDVITASTTRNVRNILLFY